MTRIPSREDGFTLIEILVVIIIIGILAAIAIPIFLNQQRAARDSATIQDVRNLASGIETALVKTILPCSRTESESGFTLIEILVVIIIIGILAAIAIPIFLNQQRTARDSATVADVRNVATAAYTGTVTYPEANVFEIYAAEEGGVPLNAAATGPLTEVWVEVGDTSTDATRIKTSKTKGTFLRIHLRGDASEATRPPGQFLVRGWNHDGQEYTSSGTPHIYDSYTGGVR